MWDLIVSVPDHCLSFYFSFITLHHLTYRHTYLPILRLNEVRVRVRVRVKVKVKVKVR